MNNFCISWHAIFLRQLTWSHARNEENFWFKKQYQYKTSSTFGQPFQSYSNTDFSTNVGKIGSLGVGVQHGRVNLLWNLGVEGIHCKMEDSNALSVGNLVWRIIRKIPRIVKPTFLRRRYYNNAMMLKNVVIMMFHFFTSLHAMRLTVLVKRMKSLLLWSLTLSLHHTTGYVSKGTKGGF